MDSDEKLVEKPCESDSKSESKVFNLQPKKKHRRGKPRCKKMRNQNNNHNYTSCVCPPPNPNPKGNIYEHTKMKRSIYRCQFAPYNTNKFLMEEHSADILGTEFLSPLRKSNDIDSCKPQRSPFSNYSPSRDLEYSKDEFVLHYEKARTERLEAFTKEEIIRDYLQMEDCYTKQINNQMQRYVKMNNLTMIYRSKIRSLEEQQKKLILENQNLRSQLVFFSAQHTSAASPPSASTPSLAAQAPTEDDLMSEDSESDSNSSGSSSNTTSSSSDDEETHNNDVQNEEPQEPALPLQQQASLIKNEEYASNLPSALQLQPTQATNKPDGKDDITDENIKMGAISIDDNTIKD